MFSGHARITRPMRRLSINHSKSAFLPPLLRTMSNQPPRRSLKERWKGFGGRIKASLQGFRSRSSSPQPSQSFAQEPHEEPRVTTGDPQNETPPQPIQKNHPSTETPFISAQDPEVNSTLSLDRIYLSPSSITEQQEAVNEPNFRDLSNVAHVPERSQPFHSIPAEASRSPLPDKPFGK